MTRNHRRPDIVLIVCRDAYHQDTDEWNRLGYHHLGTLRRELGPDGHPRLAQPGLPRWPDVIEFPGQIAIGPTMDPRFTHKPWAPDAKAETPGWRFVCPCGTNVERDMRYLIDVADRWHAAYPGRRVEMDISRL